MFKVIIAGGRDFESLVITKSKCDYFLKNVKDEIEIVSGNAKGADMCGILYAAERDYKCKIMKADWGSKKDGTYRNDAGYLRNLDMAYYADAAIVFWDGKSKGSKHMIDTMRVMKKPVRVVIYEKEFSKNSERFRFNVIKCIRT